MNTLPKNSNNRFLQYPSINPTDTSNLTCVQFKIPNRPEYRAIIRGSLKELGIWGAWARDDNQSAKYVSEMFRMLIEETLVFDEDCADMTCDEVIDCIEDELNNKDFVDKISTAIINNYGSNGLPYLPFQKGSRLPISVIGRSVVPATCNNDVLWGACISSINNLSSIVLDWVEKFETADDDLQVLNQLVDTIPAIGAIADELIVADVAEFASLLLLQFIAQYKAGDTLELRIELACILFCKVKNTCAITIQDMYDAVTEYNLIDVTDQWQVIELIVSISSGVLPDDRIYVAFLQLALMSFFASNFFSGQLGGEIFLRSIIREGFDEPSSDWTLYCNDCPSFCAEITDWLYLDPSTGNPVSMTGLITYLGEEKYRMRTYKDSEGSNTLFVFRSGGGAFDLNFRNTLGQANPSADVVVNSGGGQNTTQQQNPNITAFYWAWSGTSGSAAYDIEFFACATN